MKKSFALYFILVLFLSCDSFKSKSPVDENDVLLAAVDNEKLYLSAIARFNFAALSSADSVAFLKNYTAQWIKDEVMVRKAKEILTETDKIKAEAKKYENDLIKAAYQKKIAESLDISISQEDLSNYYETHKEYFLFEEDYFEIRYIVLPRTVSNLQQLRKTISEGKNSIFLSTYCNNNPAQCHLKNSMIKDRSFLSEALKMSDKQLNFSNGFKYHYIDNENVMIYNILAVKEKGSIAPLELVRKEVSVLTKHNKKEEYLLELEEKTYQKAKNDKIFENYIN